jgi:uncharacterized protein YdiU (UPF0061 family)
MTDHKCDFTLFFAALTQIAEGGSDKDFSALFVTTEPAMEWLDKWRALHDSAMTKGMKAVNPVYIPRNHKIEEVISSALAGDFTPFEKLICILERPFETQDDADDYKNPPTADQIVHQTFCGT